MVALGVLRCPRSEQHSTHARTTCLPASGESGGYHSRGDVLMDRNRKQLTRATVVAAAVITAGLTVVIAANRVARADLDPQAAYHAVMVDDLYGALVVAILGFVVCLVALGIHWVVRGRGAQGRTPHLRFHRLASSSSSGWAAQWPG